MYTAPTTKTRIILICISTLLITTACLQTAMVAENPTPAAPTQTAMRDLEPESGAVYEPTAESQTPIAKTCATVTAEKALHLRQKPDENSSVITWLQAGTNVLIIGKVGAWWKIESAAGTGYASAKYLQESECE